MAKFVVPVAAGIAVLVGIVTAAVYSVRGRRQSSYKVRGDPGRPKARQNRRRKKQPNPIPSLTAIPI